MLPSFAQAFANDNMSTTLPPIRKRAVKSNDDLIPGNKKRRLTPSPHPLRTDLDNNNSAPSLQSNSTPISPIGFTVQRDLIDHVRSVKQIRKKQEALIEQRRESVGASGTDDPPSSSQSLPTPLAIATAPSPSGPSSSRLPPPPISFANRAINAGKKKPADLLLVNHRDPPTNYLPSNPTRLLALHGHSLPSVQSAPPSQNAFSIPMALPSLPSNLISGPPPAIAGSRRVPPTPTRLSMLPNSAPTPPTLPNGKSPPANIPIATTLLPHTPTSLSINRAVHLGNSLLHPPSIVLSSPSSAPRPPASAPSISSTPSNSSAQAAAKQAFLAPFELFYDALQDAKQLKEWLNDQLTRTAALTKRWEEELARLERERERERDPNKEHPPLTRVKTEEGEAEVGQSSLSTPPDLREELDWLRRRVDQLEGKFGTVAVGSANTATTATVTASSSSSTSSNSSHEGYTFPQRQYDQQQQQQQQQQRQQQRQRERELRQDHHPQPAVSTPSSSLALPSISRRLSLSGRPELGRRLSSPGWHPSSASSSPSIGAIRGGSGSGTNGHRVGADGERDEGGGRAAGMVVSKSLSGPGTCGEFSSSGSSLRRRGRRVSISGAVVPGVKDRDGESLGEGSERLGEVESSRESAKREIEDRSRVQEDGEGEMNVDSVGGVEEGAESRLERAAGGQQEPDREQ